MKEYPLPTEREPVVVWQGDSLDLIKLVPQGVVITDPPYGINLRDNSQGGRYGRSRPAWENSIEGDESTAVGQAIIDWAGEQELPLVVFASPRLPWPGKWASLLVWDKGGAVAGAAMLSGAGRKRGS